MTTEENINTSKKIARIAGALFITTLVANIIGSSFIDSIVDDPDYRINLSSSKTQVIMAEFLDLLTAAAVVGIAVMMFPILKKHNENIARRYLGFRIIESAMLIIGTIIVLSLLTLSEEYVEAGAPDASHFQTLGAFALAGRDWAFKVAVIFYFMGALIFYYLLYRSKLIPRWLSGYGLIASTLAFTAIMWEIFVSNSFSNSVVFPGLLLFYLPAAPLELVLGIWLIVKGFNPSAIASQSARTDMTG